MERLRDGNDKNLFKRSINVLYKMPRDGMLRPKHIGVEMNRKHGNLIFP